MKSFVKIIVFLLMIVIPVRAQDTEKIKDWSIVHNIRDKVVLPLIDIGYSGREGAEEEICATCDIEKMNTFVDKIQHLGISEIDKGNTNIDISSDWSLLESIFITLWIPNTVLNTEGEHLSGTCTRRYKTPECPYPEFASKVLEKGRHSYKILLEYFKSHDGNEDKLLKKTCIGTKI